MKNVNEELLFSLRDAGFKISIVSTQHLSDVKSDLKILREQRIFDTDFYDERLAHYTFEPPDDFPEAKSIIITAARQPKVKVTFRLSGTPLSAIIPPTYSYGTDKNALNSITETLRTYGYRVRDATLPVKSLAVHSGLASYGRNNIAYIDGWGSYFRLKAFFSDMPCSDDHWQEYRIMDRCNTCVACLKKCPSGAISSERFVFHGERCITFLNERSKPFPDWVDPIWHNCIVGCMICQDVCPANNEFADWSVEGAEFSEEETETVLRGIPESKLPEETREKLDALDMLEYWDVLQRNISVLINTKESLST